MLDINNDIYKSKLTILIKFQRITITVVQNRLNMNEENQDIS